MGHETVESKIKNFREIEEVISRAIKKVGAKRENDICRYIPMHSGGYMHHFTLKKMKSKQPSELSAMIEKFIINADRPGMVAPKQRAPRGSRKRRDHLNFTRSQLERMLMIARNANDQEIISILSPKTSLTVLKRELIVSIRQNRVESDLWAAYVELIKAQQMGQNTEHFNQINQ